MATPVTPPIERFYRHTVREGSCLIWTSTFAGTKSRRPQFRATTKMSEPKVYAHRWIYEQVVGPIPEGYEIDHTCKDGRCVEVAHLEAVPPAVNQSRERQVLCTRGLHDLGSPENCRWDNKGRRRGCIQCKRAATAARYRRNKGGQ